MPRFSATFCFSNNLKLTFSSIFKNGCVSLVVYFYIHCFLIFNFAGFFSILIEIAKLIRSNNVVVNRNIVHCNRTILPNRAAQIQSDTFRRPHSGCAEHHTRVNRSKQAVVATATTTARLKLSLKPLIGVSATSSKMPKLSAKLQSR